MFFLKKNVRVVVKNQNLALELKTGTNLYEALVRENVIPQTLCRGNGQCGKCKVHITQKNLVRPNKKEQLVLARINLDAGFRLACQTVIREDMIIDTSEIMANSRPMGETFTVRPLKDIPKEDAINISDIAAPIEPVMPVIPIISDPIRQEISSQQQEAVGFERAVQEKRTEKPKEIKKNEQTLDGLLLIENKNQIRYFLYSAAIDSVSQEGVLDSEEKLSSYIENGTIMDYIHDRLKITEIDRLIIFCDDPSDDGEALFDIVSYQPFDIGPLPCEIIHPLKGTGDFSLFLRLLATKNKKRLLISLDKLDHTYYIADDKVVQLPFAAGVPVNLFEGTGSVGENPVVDISDDFKTITPQKAFYAPDSLPLPMVMKVAALMVKKKLANADLKIAERTALPGDMPLDYIVKMVSYEGENAFYLLRSKDGSLLITQSIMDILAHARSYLHFAVDYTEANLGNIENIAICTPATLSTLTSSMVALGMVPARHQDNMLHSPGDSAVMAVKLFQEPDVRAYIHKNYGTYIKSE